MAPHTILLTGLAGLVAGAFSMGAGEYVSVTNQNELVAAEVALEADMQARFPSRSTTNWWPASSPTVPTPTRRSGWPRRSAKDPEQALRVHTRDELGVDPNELPSPWLAGGSSFVAFSLGALLPLIPYLAGVDSLVPSLVLSGVALLAGGMVVGRLTGRPLVQVGCAATGCSVLSPSWSRSASAS